MISIGLAGCTPVAQGPVTTSAAQVSPSDNKEQTTAPARDVSPEAMKRFQNGLSLKEDDPEGARKEFLATLRLQPDMMEALKELRALHFTVTEDQMNGRLSKQKKKAEQSAKDDIEKSVEQEDFDGPEKNIAAEAINLYKSGNYEKASQRFSALSRNEPSNADYSRYLNLSYMGLGIATYNRKEFKKAMSIFQRVKKGFESVDEWIKKCVNGMKQYAEDVYKTGMKFYREQNLKSAIEKWREVLALEPDHARAKEYLEKAIKLQSTLDRQKR